MTVMGPNGVDALVRETLMECWKSLPEETRSMQTWRKRADEVFTRNMKTWIAMKKPTPEAFFANLLPFPSDGHFRQALVLCHMMLPRGKRGTKDVARVVEAIFVRNVASWEADFKTLTKGMGGARAKKPAAKPKKPAPKKKSAGRKR